MWQQFLLQNVHFTLNLFASLVMLAIAWLYFDAVKQHKTLKDILKVIGFLFLQLSFILSAITLESAFLSKPIVSLDLLRMITAITRNAGYAFILFGLIIDPLQKIPNLANEKPLTQAFIGFFYVSFPLSFVISLFYLLKATKGLERHLRLPFWGFLILSLSELLSGSSFFRTSKNIDVLNLVDSFGPLWIIENVLLLVSVLILGKWVFTYLLKRFETQLLIISTSTTLCVFILTAVSYSTILFKNIESESLNQLEVSSKVFSYAIDAKKDQILSDSELLSQNGYLITALNSKDYKALGDIAENFLVYKNQSSLLITDLSGQVVARGEDKPRIGESLSSDPLIKRALHGEKVTSVMLKEGVPAPELFLRASTPIRFGDSVIGTVLTGTKLDNALLDGVKKATNLDSLVFASDVLSASTVVLSNGSRSIGIKEINQTVISNVLGKGENFSGGVKFINTSYYMSYQPLKDIDNNSIGMLAVGRPQIDIFHTAGKSIEQTFLVTVLLIIASLLPTYLISKYIVYQIK